jgi:hypothetical protein
MPHIALHASPCRVDRFVPIKRFRMNDKCSKIGERNGEAADLLDGRVFETIENSAIYQGVGRKVDRLSGQSP